MKKITIGLLTIACMLLGREAQSQNHKIRNEQVVFIKRKFTHKKKIKMIGTLEILVPSKSSKVLLLSIWSNGTYKAENFVGSFYQDGWNWMLQSRSMDIFIAFTSIDRKYQLTSGEYEYESDEVQYPVQIKVKRCP